jgi:hypothetical protein
MIDYDRAFHLALFVFLISPKSPLIRPTNTATAQRAGTLCVTFPRSSNGSQNDWVGCDPVVVIPAAVFSTGHLNRD